MSTQPAGNHIKPRRYCFPDREGNEAQAATQEPSLMTGTPLPGGISLPSSIPAIPSSQQSHLRSGLKLYVQGETLHALWAFFEGIGTEPRNALGHYLCGLAYQALESAEEAQGAWVTVLILTSGEARASRETLPDSEPHSEMQWVRSMAERLIEKGAMSPSRIPDFADFPSVQPRSVSGPGGRQAELEKSILEDVRLHGSCYVKD